MEKMKCPKCSGSMKPVKGVIEEDEVEFNAFRCEKCGEELLDMKQLNKLASHYRKFKEAEKVVFAKWGNSIAVRIPSSYVKELKITPGKSAVLMKERNGLRIIA